MTPYPAQQALVTLMAVRNAAVMLGHVTFVVTALALSETGSPSESI